MDVWVWVARLGWMVLGFTAGSLVIGVMAMAHDADHCYQCLYYQQFLKAREEANASACESKDEGREGETFQNRRGRDWQGCGRIG